MLFAIRRYDATTLRERLDVVREDIEKVDTAIESEVDALVFSREMSVPMITGKPFLTQAIHILLFLMSYILRSSLKLANP